MTHNKPKSRIDKYLFKDNVRRLFLFDMLRRKKYLQNVTLEELDELVMSINVLTSNLQHDFEKGKPMIDVGDRDNWSSSTLFRDIFLHNVLDIVPQCAGTKHDFKEMLKERWAKQSKKITKKEE